MKKTPLRDEIKDAPDDRPPISSGKKTATPRRVASSAVRAKAMPTAPNMKAASLEQASRALMPGLSEGRVERPTEFAPVTLDELIAHDVLLERYPWLSAQILNRWRRKGLIRSFRGKGAVLYSRQELDRALDSEMRLEDQPEARQRPAPQSSSQRDQLISNVYRLEKSLRSLSKSGILEPKHVDLLNQRRQEVGMGLITAEQPPPPQPKERALKKTTP